MRILASLLLAVMICGCANQSTPVLGGYTPSTPKISISVVKASGEHPPLPKVFNNTLFLYPSEEFRTAVTGRVYASLDVSSSGSVTDVHILESSHRDFEHAAVEGCRRVSFFPARSEGLPVPSTVECEVDFELDDD
jgi:TonB family protein